MKEIVFCCILLLDRRKLKISQGGYYGTNNKFAWFLTRCNGLASGKASTCFSRTSLRVYLYLESVKRRKISSSSGNGCLEVSFQTESIFLCLSVRQEKSKAASSLSDRVKKQKLVVGEKTNSWLALPFSFFYPPITIRLGTPLRPQKMDKFCYVNRRCLIRLSCHMGKSSCHDES